MAFIQFALDYGFHYQTSSPNYPQSNDEVECVVQTVKSILKKATNLYLGLLSYQATPFVNGYSSAELLKRRKMYK